MVVRLIAPSNLHLYYEAREVQANKLVMRLKRSSIQLRGKQRFADEIQVKELGGVEEVMFSLDMGGYKLFALVRQVNPELLMLCNWWKQARESGVIGSDERILEKIRDVMHRHHERRRSRASHEAVFQ